MSETGSIFDEVYTNPDYQSIVIFIMQYREQLQALLAKKKKTPRDPVYVGKGGMLDALYSADIVNGLVRGSSLTCENAITGRGAGLAMFDPASFAASIFLGKPRSVQEDTICKKQRKNLSNVDYPYLDPFYDGIDPFPYALPDGHDFFGTHARRVMDNVAYSFSDGKNANFYDKTESTDIEFICARLIMDLLWLLDLPEIVTLNNWQSMFRIALDITGITKCTSADDLDTTQNTTYTIPGPSSIMKHRGNPLVGSVFEVDRSTRLVSRDWRVYATHAREHKALHIEEYKDKLDNVHLFVNIVAEHKTILETMGTEEADIIEQVAERRSKNNDHVSIDPKLYHNHSSDNVHTMYDSGFLYGCTEAIVDLLWPSSTVEVQLERPFFVLDTRQRLRCVKQLCDALLLKLKLTGERLEPGLGGNVWVWQRPSDGLVTACVDIHGDLPTPIRKAVAVPPVVSKKVTDVARTPLKSVTIEVIGGVSNTHPNIVKNVPKNGMMARFLGLTKVPKKEEPPVNTDIVSTKEEFNDKHINSTSINSTNNNTNDNIKEESRSTDLVVVKTPVIVINDTNTDNVDNVDNVDHVDHVDHVDNTTHNNHNNNNTTLITTNTTHHSLLSTYHSQLKAQKYKFYPICTTLANLSTFSSAVAAIFPNLQDTAALYQDTATAHITHLELTLQKEKDDLLWVNKNPVAPRQSRRTALDNYLSSDSEEIAKVVKKKARKTAVIEDSSASEETDSASGTSSSEGELSDVYED